VPQRHPDGQSSAPFTSRHATVVLREACRIAGVSDARSQMMRLGENALFYLPAASVIARIARGPEVWNDAAKEVAVAGWLREAGLPAAETADLAQPITAIGHPVTFWKPVPNSDELASAADLGTVLRRLHDLPVPVDLQLPQFDMFGRVGERLDRVVGVDSEDVAFLRRRVAELRDRYADLEFPSAPGALHGDAHIQNLIKTPSGQVVLIDFERFAFGPREIDLSTTACERDLGWHTAAEYETFCEAYGYDVTAWEGFGVVRDINHLKMTTWLMQNVTEGPDVAAEFQTRLASLRGAPTGTPWRPF
jgi:hypothetical protein